MKTFLLLSAFLTWGMMASFASNFELQPFETSEVRMDISKGNHPGFSVNIPEANRAIAEHIWEKSMRNRTKSKMERIGNEYVISATYVERISAMPINLYAMIEEEGKGLTFYVFVETDSGFVSEETDMIKAAAIHKELTIYAKDVFKETVKWQVKNEENKLHDMKRELKRLERDKEKMHKHIAVNLEDISQANAELEQNNYRLRSSYGITTTTNENGEIDRAPAPTSLDPKVKKEIEKENKKLRKKIVKYESNNREEESLVSMNIAAQEAKLQEIEAQEAYIRQLKEKMEILKK